MTFLILEFLALAFVSRLVSVLSDPHTQWAILLPPSGHMFIPVYLWVSARIFWHFMRRESPERRVKFTIAYAYKLVFTALMTYLLITRYNYGDFRHYYVLPYWMSEQILSFNFDAFGQIELVTQYLYRDFSLDSTTIIAFVFTGIFLIFPASLYGLAFLSGTVIFLACLKIYKLFESRIKYKRIFFYAYFFTPSLTLQLGYTGKETLILPLVAGILTLAQRNRNLAGQITLLMAVFYVRFYQAFFLVIAWAGTHLSLRKLFSVKGIPFLVALIPILIFIYTKAMATIGGLGFDSLTQIAEFLSTVYAEGSLILEPWPFPLTYLQIFRPFPWEANNAMALVVAMESVVLLGLTVYLLVSQFGSLKQRFRLDPFFRFVAMYVIVQVAIFSYNNNMGDLARRKIYFIPLMIALLCCRRMDEEEINVAIATGRLKIRRAAAEPPSASVPASSPEVVRNAAPTSAPPNR